MLFSILIIFVITSIFNILENKIWYSITIFDLLIGFIAITFSFISALILAIALGWLLSFTEKSDLDFDRSIHRVLTFYLIGGKKDVDNQD